MVTIVNKLPDENINTKKSEVTILKAIFLLFSLAIATYLLFFIITNAFVFLYKDKVNTICKSALSKQFCTSKYNNESNDIQKLVNDLLGHVNYCNDIKVCVYDFPYKNAFASCGDFIIVSKKLYNDAKKVDDLGFVLAHEIAHIVNKDTMHNIAKALSSSFTSIIFSLSLDSEISNLISAQTQFNSNFYTRKQELQADKTAIKIIKKNYTNIYPTLKFFENLLKEDQSIKNDVSIIDYYFKNKPYNKKDAHNFLSTYTNNFDTHPAYQKRMESIIETLKSDNMDE